jgi:hypothetical protein
MSSEEESLIEKLIEMGIIIPLGFSEDHGQDMYMISDKAEEAFPELIQEQERYVNEAVFDLWNLDLVDIVFDDNGDALVGLNKNSTDKDKIEAIENDDLKRAMYAILLAFADTFGHSKE